MKNKILPSSYKEVEEMLIEEGFTEITEEEKNSDKYKDSLELPDCYYEDLESKNKKAV